MDLFNTYLPLIENLLYRYGFIIVFVGMALESIIGVGLLFPGMIMLLLASFYAGQGVLDVTTVLAASMLGVIVGDNISYWVGRRGLVKLPMAANNKERLGHIEEALRGKNRFFLIFFQFASYSRMIVPAFLGILKYPWKQWLALDITGSILFSATFTLLGFYIGRITNNLEQAFGAARYIQYGFLAIFLWWLVSFIVVIRRVWSKKE